ncbi:MAG: hypothetical protein Q7S86_04305 [bacterium]|nr:hypothetical protein [bacterium]
MRELLNEKLLIIQDPKPEYELDLSDPHARAYIPARWAWFLKPCSDIIVLPEYQGMREWWKFIQKTLRLSRSQAFFTSGKKFTMSGELLERVAEIGHHVNSLDEGGALVFPYSRTKGLTAYTDSRWQVLGDPQPWARRYSDKGILHPCPPGVSRPQALPILTNVPVCRGYTCRADEREILLAYWALKKSGVKKVIAKARNAAAGDGFVLDFTPDRLNAEILKVWEGYSGVVLEEMRGKFVAGSLQFVGRETFSEPTLQITNGPSYSGNEVPARYSKKARRKILEVTETVLGQIKPQGPGALDFLVEGDEVFLVDPNLGRTTGGMIGRFFRERYAPHSCYRTWKIPAKFLSRMPDVETFYDRLGRRGLHPNFALTRNSPEVSGVFPLCYLQRIWGMLIAVGEDFSQVERFYEEAMECLV